MSEALEPRSLKASPRSGYVADLRFLVLPLFVFFSERGGGVKGEVHQSQKLRFWAQTALGLIAMS